jgi:hypothetical protein
MANLDDFAAVLEKKIRLPLSIPGSPDVVNRKVVATRSEEFVKTTLFLRAASVLTLIHAVLHTVGGVLGKPQHGPEEFAVIETMKSHVFDVMGSMRSYWDFNFGYGLMVSITLLVQAVLFWQLATMAKTNARWTKPILILFFFNFVATSVVAWKYFFVAPAVTEISIAACLAAAYFTANASPSTPE